MKKKKTKKVIDKLKVEAGLLHSLISKEITPWKDLTSDEKIERMGEAFAVLNRDRVRIQDRLRMLEWHTHNGVGDCCIQIGQAPNIQGSSSNGYWPE